MEKKKKEKVTKLYKTICYLDMKNRQILSRLNEVAILSAFPSYGLKDNCINNENDN